MAESLPPLTIADLEESLKNPHFSSYVYIGPDDSEGWAIAVDMQFNLPALRIFRVDATLETEIRNKYQVPAGRVGVVFDWTTNVKKTLTAAQAEDFSALLDAINAART
jgi:hypothetical protein